MPSAGAPAAAAPIWVQGLYAYLDAAKNDIARLRGEHMILLANSQAGHGSPLYDPTFPAQWTLLAAPNPTSRNDLMAFDRK